MPQGLFSFQESEKGCHNVSGCNNIARASDEHDDGNATTDNARKATSILVTAAEKTDGERGWSKGKCRPFFVGIF